MSKPKLDKITPSASLDDIIKEKVENKLEDLVKNMKPEAPPCDCFKNATEPDTGPYYAHLGVASSLANLRTMMEERCQVQTPQELRIEKAIYCRREGKSSLGCPIAKYIIRRKRKEEKYLVVTKERTDHKCEYKWIVMGIVAWEGMQPEWADRAYDDMAGILGKYGKAFQRQCESNSSKTCACQGLNDSYSGASFTFGCSWSMYFDGCKYGKAGNRSGINKFKLAKDATQENEEQVETTLNSLATWVAPLYQRLAPDSYGNMTAFQKDAEDCRIGFHTAGRPFSGVTAVSDFCAHAHRDNNNMNAGCTVIVTLTKPENRGINVKPDDEQLHVLPQYRIDDTDEFGDKTNHLDRMLSGEIEVLSKFERKLISRSKKRKGCKRGHPSGKRKRFLDSFLKVSKTNSDLKTAVAQASAASDEPRPPKRGKNKVIAYPVKTEFVAPGNPMPPLEPIRQMHQNVIPHATAPITQQTLIHTVNNVPVIQQQTRIPVNNQFMPGIYNTAPPSTQVKQTLPTFESIRSPPMTPPDEMYQENYQELLNESYTYDSTKFPNTFAGGAEGFSIQSQLDGNVSPIPQTDGGEDYYGGRYPQYPYHPLIPPQQGYQYNQYPAMWQRQQQTQNVPPFTQPLTPVTSPVKSPDDPERDQISIEKSDCAENFGDDKVDIGGLAIALPHGSVLFECAKQELHATTALKQPNRYKPTRIGLVFYQHKNLMYPQHGYNRVCTKTKEKNERDYELWLAGKFTPTPRKLEMMRADGLQFPDNVKTVPPGTDMLDGDHEKPNPEFLLQVERPGNKPFKRGDMKTIPAWSSNTITLPVQYPSYQQYSWNQNNYFTAMN